MKTPFRSASGSRPGSRTFPQVPLNFRRVQILSHAPEKTDEYYTTDMTIKRLVDVSVVDDDLGAARAFPGSPL